MIRLYQVKIKASHPGYKNIYIRGYVSASTKKEAEISKEIILDKIRGGLQEGCSSRPPFHLEIVVFKKIPCDFFTSAESINQEKQQ